MQNKLVVSACPAAHRMTIKWNFNLRDLRFLKFEPVEGRKEGQKKSHSVSDVNTKECL